MLKILKKIFHNPDKETIEIFEEETKIDYNSSIFLSLEVLSLTNSRLKNLKPLAVFKNLEILNLSNNQIQTIECLKDLQQLKIIDLRFNKITKVPLWVFKLNKPLYWERENEEEEGIYLEGNPLDKRLIEKIKHFPKKKPLLPPIVTKKIEKESLIPLKRQQIAIFLPESFSSHFIQHFTEKYSHQLQLNIPIVEYNKEYKIIDSNQKLYSKLRYIIIVLNKSECCLNPPIIETLSKLYIKSRLFLIMEKDDKRDIKEKIKFFKTYNKSNNIIEVYHTSNIERDREIKEKIYHYLNQTQEANSLWKESWIALRNEIEKNHYQTIDYQEFQLLAKKHAIPSEMNSELFNYLKRVGTIKVLFEKS